MESEESVDQGWGARANDTKRKEDLRVQERNPSVGFESFGCSKYLNVGFLTGPLS